MNNFNNIAPYYDNLASLIFGKAIKKSQLKFLSVIPPNSHIMILGGGTGWIAKSVFDLTENTSIVYLEKSQKMISLTQNLLAEEHYSKITFVNKSFEDFEMTEQFDVVIGNFFFDLFSASQLKKVIGQTKLTLKKGGLLLVADFQIINNPTSKLWQKPMSILMHLFFRVVSDLQSRRLNPIKDEILNSKFEVQSEKSYFGKMIFSSVYKNC